MEVLNPGDRVLIIQTAFIGDCLLTLPLIALLDRKYPGIKIDLITTVKSAEIFQSFDKVNNTFLFEKRGKHKSLRGLLKFASEIRSRGYRCVIAPHRSARTSILVMLSGIRETYGFRNSALKFAYRHQIEYAFGKHEVFRNLAFTGDDISIEDLNSIIYNIAPGEGEPDIINRTRETASGRKIIAVAPGTEWATKQYPAEYFTEIIRFFSTKGYAIAVIGSEREAEISAKIAQESGADIINLCGKLSIPGTINFLKHCAALLTNDSSPVHMAYIAGTKTVAVYCSTVPEFGFYPLGNGSIWVSNDSLNCKPCGIHGFKLCPLEHFKCGKELLPETVINKMEKIIDNER